MIARNILNINIFILIFSYINKYYYKYASNKIFLFLFIKLYKFNALIYY